MPPELPPFDPAWQTAYQRALGLVPVRLAWAKTEIVLGLASAFVGIAWTGPDVARGALFVLGGFLALAGHRSHLYASLNRQAAYAAQLARGGGRAPGHA